MGLCVPLQTSITLDELQMELREKLQSDRAETSRLPVVGARTPDTLARLRHPEDFPDLVSVPHLGIRSSLKSLSLRHAKPSFLGLRGGSGQCLGIISQLKLK